MSVDSQTFDYAELLRQLQLSNAEKDLQLLLSNAEKDRLEKATAYHAVITVES